MECTCCKNEAFESIMVMEGVNNPPNTSTRYYLPNKGNRDQVGKFLSPDELVEMHLCKDCMRAVEDNFRATVQYLMSEGGKLKVSPI